MFKVHALLKIKKTKISYILVMVTHEEKNSCKIILFLTKIRGIADKSSRQIWEKKAIGRYDSLKG